MDTTMKVNTKPTARPTLKLPPSARGRPITVWWVQCVGRRPPKKAHLTKEAALAEGLRLSQLPESAALRFQIRESRYLTTFCDGAEVRS